MEVAGHEVYIKLAKGVDTPAGLFPIYRVKLMSGEIGRIRPIDIDRWQAYVRRIRPVGESGTREQAIIALIERYERRLIEKQQRPPRPRKPRLAKSA